MRRRKLVVAAIGVLCIIGAGCAADNPELEAPIPVNDPGQTGEEDEGSLGPSPSGLFGGGAAQAPPRAAGAVDLDGAYGLFGAAYHHMFQFGDLLAGAIAGQKAVGEVKT
ncbi:MAG: hypothetical protein ACRDV9_00745, partial [Acidimicrobiia bacterium]